MRRWLVSMAISVAGVLGMAMVTAAAAAPPAAVEPVILVWGDSLSASYGVPRDLGWASLLQQRLRSAGYPHRVVNGSVSGETTAGGLARLPQALAAHRPALLLLELGGNDGLRGLPVKQLRANLKAMIGAARKAGAKTLLFEMQLPANYGPAYRADFGGAFAALARDEKVRLVPFFLAPIAQEAAYFQEDGIHPTAAAQPRLLEAVWPTLLPELPASHPARAAPRN